MSTIQITEDISQSVRRAKLMLAGIDGGAEKALESAASRATSFLRANSGRAIRERYDISQKAIRAEQNVRVSYDFSNGAQVTISFRGNKIPLYRYGGTSPKEPTQDKSRTIAAIIEGRWRQTYPSVAASAHILKTTTPTTFRNAFVARMSSGHKGIFERTGGVSASGSDAIREIMGLSVPQMLGNEEVCRHLADEAMIKFNDRLEHEITRLLNGWGV